jgi:Ser/Thr protein kinase RdoA (MazF antagonist)
MMKLRYLFNNPDLAEMLLKNWDYDQDSVGLFQNYRISANAIYPFRRDGELYYLRFCPVTEKRRENILAELAFINFLHGREYPAVEPLPSNSGEELVQQTTPWGDYYASAFKGVGGVSLEETNLKEEIVFSFGACLGQLHNLSSQYRPQAPILRTHHSMLDWMEEALLELDHQSAALNEVNLLRNYFSVMNSENGSYGLIHFDFELDNVFYDENVHLCSVIDFDDMMLHWYDEGWKTAIPAFRRYGNLLRYTRIARAIQEEWKNEPDWMRLLRIKLGSRMIDYASVFATSL